MNPSFSFTFQVLVFECLSMSVMEHWLVLSSSVKASIGIFGYTLLLPPIMYLRH